MKRQFGGGPGRGGPGSGGPLGAMMRPGEKAKNFKGTIKRLIKYLRPRRIQLLIVTLMAIFSTLFSVVSPKIMGTATTKLFEGVMMKVKGASGTAFDIHFLVNILITLIALYLISALFGYIQQYIMAGVAQRTVYDLRQDLNDKLARLPLKYFDGRTHGEILSRITNDIDNIAGTLQQSLTQLITSIITLLGVTIMMLSISPLLTLVTLIMIPLSIIITATIAKRSQKYFAAQQKTLGMLNGHVEEMMTGHSVVKGFGQERESLEAFDKINHTLFSSAWKAQFISGIIMPLLNFVNNIGYVLVCVAGGVLVIRKAIMIGDIQAFIQYSRQFAMPITQTANIANILQSTAASAERVFELLDESEEIPDNTDSVVPTQTEGAVRFENVGFSYKNDTPLIDNLNIDVKPGETIAIVGPTGAGKTTLVNLLMRFYELQNGKITIDGIDIKKFKRGDLRSLFGMVLQDTWLFNGTIRDNIAYGKEKADDTQIMEASMAAHADHFIRTLPEGYKTILNEEASNISQGQKQLLTIARALLADPAILILDEATSNVDTRTEVAIQKALHELKKGRTNFVIAHRLSTIRNADLILVMDKGHIIETGDHQTLMAKNGFYTQLYNSQFAGPEA